MITNCLAPKVLNKIKQNGTSLVKKKVNENASRNNKKIDISLRERKSTFILSNLSLFEIENKETFITWSNSLKNKVHLWEPFAGI